MAVIIVVLVTWAVAATVVAAVSRAQLAEARRHASIAIRMAANAGKRRPIPDDAAVMVLAGDPTLELDHVHIWLN